MARPSSIRDETILEAASAVFLERGIQATTAEVAERAGVSEGTLFNRFKSKHELFRAAMLAHGARAPWVASLEERVGKGKVRDHLIELGLQIVDFFRVLIPFMMMSYANKGPGEVPHVLSEPNPPPLVAIRKLIAYFEAEALAGRIRRTSPEVLARSFVGGLQSFAFFELLLKGRDPAPMSAEEFVRGHVSLLWNGIAPED
jgi:AcrR family transcriptional regulator